MFTVKATYRKELRKFSFDTDSFPSFDQLRNSLYRVFPSLHNYYLSRLLFSPEASQSGRILIGQEVHSEEEYGRCIFPYNNRRWSNGLLRFTVLDEMPHKGRYPTIGSLPVQDDANISSPGLVNSDANIASMPRKRPSQYIPVSHIPPPPIIFSSPRPHVQGPKKAHTSPISDFVETSLPSFQSYSQTFSCCPVEQGKHEIRSLLSDFQRKLDDILVKTFGNPATSSMPRESIKMTSPPALFHSSSPSCMLCSKNVAAQVHYTCQNCATILCYDCYVTGKSGFCTYSVGPHLMKEKGNVPYDILPGPPCPPQPWPLPSTTSSWPPPFHASPTPWYAWPSGPQIVTNDVFATHAAESSPFPFIPSLSTPIVQGPSVPYRPFTAPCPFITTPMQVNPIPPPAAPHTRPRDVPQPPPPPAPVFPPAPCIHHGIICDVCEKVIEGIRHKCLDCPEYDLCTTCINGGGAERHDPFHEFLEIREPGRVIVHHVDNVLRHGPHAPTNNVQGNVTIHSAVCDLCDSRIRGHRYKCTICPDFDTCESCFSITKEQHPRHSFVRVLNPGDYIRRDEASHAQHNATCDACNKRIDGVRFKCMHPECPDFDLCEKCEAHPISLHPDRHPLLKLKSAAAFIPKIRGKTELLRRDSTKSVKTCSSLPFERGFPFNSPVLSIHEPTIELQTSPELSLPHQARTTSTNPVSEPSLLRLSSNKPTSSTAVDFEQKPPSPPSPLLRPCSYRSPSQTSISTLPGSVVTPQGKISYPWDTDEDDGSLPVRLSRLVPFIPSPVESFCGDVSTPPFSIDTSEIAHLQEHLSRPLTPERLTSISDHRKEVISAKDNQPISSPPEEVANDRAEGSQGCKSESLRVLNCLISDPVSPSSPAPACEVSQKVTEGSRANSPVTSTVFESPLGNEALLIRPPSPGGLDPPDATPATIIMRSLAALLEDHRSAISKDVFAQDALLVAKADEPVPVLGKNTPLSANFIQDVTVSDGAVFPPGAEFVKCWKMLNDGERDWPESTELIFVAGVPLADDPQRVKVGAVKAGCEVELWTGELKAPDVPGRYVSYWRLKDDKGTLFGTSIWVDIEVAEATKDLSDRSLASSSIIMPNPVRSLSSDSTRPQIVVPSRSTSSITVSSKRRSNSDASSDGESSSASLISVPPSDEEDEDGLWEASRLHVPSDHRVSQRGLSYQEYVMLYEDNTSGEED